MDISILNKKFETVMIMDVYESLIWTDRYNSYGDFEIYTSVDSVAISNIQQGYYLWSEESEHSMIIDGIQIKTDVELGNHIIITGKSLESILQLRIVWDQIILNGNLQGQIEKLFNENIINPKDEKRKISNFIFQYSEDPSIKNLTIQAQYTGDDLYSVIKNICDDNKIGFKIFFNKSFQMVFQLYAGKDRSYKQESNPYVVFSPNYENIINSNYLDSSENYRNIALVAGEGQGNSRKKVTVGDANLSGLERRELYVDARDLSSVTDDGTAIPEKEYEEHLIQRGKDYLSENKIAKSFEGQVDTSKSYKYKEDFYMGDICQLENEFGMQSRVRVIEFIYSESDNGIETYPTFEVEDEEVI